MLYPVFQFSGSESYIKLAKMAFQNSALTRRRLEREARERATITEAQEHPLGNKTIQK